MMATVERVGIGREKILRLERKDAKFPARHEFAPRRHEGGVVRRHAVALRTEIGDVQPSGFDGGVLRIDLPESLFLFKRGLERGEIGFLKRLITDNQAIFFYGLLLVSDEMEC